MKFLIKTFKNQKIQMVIILSFLLFLYTSICAFSYAQSVSTDLQNSVFRLHVIANSDSKEDQNLKYKVRAIHLYIHLQLFFSSYLMAYNFQKFANIYIQGDWGNVTVTINTAPFLYTGTI